MTVLALALSGFLCACGHVPTTSALQMRALDFTNTDAGLVRAAIRHPDTIRVSPGGATLEIFFAEPDGSRKIEHFVLAEVADPVEIAELADKALPARSLTLYRIAPADLPRAAAMQAKARDRAASAGPKGGGFSVGAEGCRIGPLPDGPLPVSTFFKSAETGRFITLVDEMDLKSVRGSDGRPVQLPECGAAVKSG